MQYRLELVRPENIQASQKSDYTMREGKYTNRRKNQEDLVYKTEGNIPSWAKNSGEFWKIAEEITAGTKKNIYFEMRLSLQEELSAEDNIEVIENFLQRTGIKDSHVYSYAIHDKIAAFDSEHRNIHAHIMINEKILEKDRPLEPEQFFKKYAKNKAGELVGGYRVSRAFQRENIENLRQTWEQCINEKFAELGYNLKVDCRTLKAQKDDYLNHGMTLEAKACDREPGVHLGPKFLNPKLKDKIDKTIEYIRKNKDYQVLIEPDENTSWIDKQIYLFAKDYIARTAAKEILKQRTNELKAARQEQEIKELSFSMDEPFVITAGQLKAEILRRNIEHKTQLEQYESRYAWYSKKIIPTERLDFTAKDLFCEGRYKKALANYKRTALLYKQKDAEEIQAIKLKQQDRFTELHKETTKLYEEKNMWGKELEILKKKIAGNAPAIEALKTKLTQDNAEAIRQRNRYSIEIQKKKELIALEQKKLEELIRFLPEDQVIFTNKLPPTLGLQHKLFGIKPLTELRIMRISQNLETDGQYLLLEGTEHTDKDGNKYHKAVKLHSDLNKGRATVYLINLSTKKVTATDDLIPVYKVRDPLAVTKTETKPKLEKTAAANIPVIAPKVTKIVQNLTDKLMQSNVPPTQISWMPDDDQDYIINGKIDEAKLVEKSLGL